MTRRVSRLLASACIAALLSPVAHAAKPDTVRTESGLLTSASDSDDHVRIFRGIPYAQPPVGDLRWRPPQPPASWTGVHSADSFGPSCMQEVVGSRPPWTEEFMVQDAVSEDCLYLNVWTPSERADGGLPVLVYIHGGAFREGSGSVAVYDGENLARQGLIVVTINYRLGIFGFLAHPELREESPHLAAGNYGLLDQIAALQWIQENIEAFGGDPNRVTIAGQSAGAMSVHLLLASPLAAGLFHGAIVQSGPGGLAAFGVASDADLALPLPEAEKAGLEFARAKGASSIGELRSLGAEDLMSESGGGRPQRFGPVIDGWCLPESVDAIFASGRQNDVPTMSGMNADEASAFPGYGQATVDAFREEARRRYDELAESYISLYDPKTDEEAGQAQKQAARHVGLTALRSLADRRAETAETPIYLYYFERAIPWPEYPNFGAFHTGEVPYVFDNLQVLDRPWTDQDVAIANRVSTYWVNFAATGNPNGGGLPEWPAYESPNGKTMILGTEMRAAVLPEPAYADFFREVLKR